MTPVLAESLCVGYNGNAVLENISLCAEKGEIITLIGSNGCGKSTLLKTLAGRLSPISGSLNICGRNIAEMTHKDIAEKVSVMLTEKTETEYMTCRDVVEQGRFPYTGRLGILSEEDRKITDMSMEETDSLHLADRDFRKISDGQRQRVLLAKAVCQQPQILLLDEPTLFLDIKYKTEFAYMIRKFAAEKGITVIMSLHETDLAARLSDRVLCLKNGHTDRCGAPSEFLDDGYLCSLFDVDAEKYNAFFR